MTVGHVEHVLAVPARVERDSQPGHEPVGIDADDPAGRFAAHALVANAEVGRPVAVDHPVILGVDGVVVDVERGASDRQPVLDERFARDEDRDQTSVRVEQRRTAGVLVPSRRRRRSPSTTASCRR